MSPIGDTGADAHRLPCTACAALGPVADGPGLARFRAINAGWSTARGLNLCPPCTAAHNAAVGRPGAVSEAYDPTEALYELGEAWHQLSHDWTFGLASGYTPAQQARIDELVAEAAAAGVDLTFDDETGRWYATPA